VPDVGGVIEFHRGTISRGEVVNDIFQNNGNMEVQRRPY